MVNVETTLHKQITELEIGDLFSFSKQGSVHMVTEVKYLHIEYKSYADGKIRVEYLSRSKPVFIREEYAKLYEAKHFINL